MVEVPIDDHPEDQFMVCGDIPAFRSPLDGTLVEGRRAYHDHMRRHNVVPFEAGSEKVRAAGKTPQERQALREQLWQYVDTAIQRGPKRRVSD
jgi:hypothetical protein